MLYAHFYVCAVCLIHADRFICCARCCLKCYQPYALCSHPCCLHCFISLPFSLVHCRIPSLYPTLFLFRSLSLPSLSISLSHFLTISHCLSLSYILSLDLSPFTKIKLNSRYAYENVSRARQQNQN